MKKDKVILVDNNSTDNTVSLVENNFPDIEIISENSHYEIFFSYFIHML